MCEVCGDEKKQSMDMENNIMKDTHNVEKKYTDKWVESKMSQKYIQIFTEKYIRIYTNIYKYIQEKSITNEGGEKIK